MKPVLADCYLCSSCPPSLHPLLAMRRALHSIGAVLKREARESVRLQSEWRPGGACRPFLAVVAGWEVSSAARDCSNMRSDLAFSVPCTLPIYIRTSIST